MTSFVFNSANCYVIEVFNFSSQQFLNILGISTYYEKYEILLTQTMDE